MKLAAVRKYITSKPGAWEDTPFGPDVLVPKVGKKMFALVAWKTDPLRLSLKGDPFLNEVLREEWDAVILGYHLNKKHWNYIQQRQHGRNRRIQTAQKVAHRQGRKNFQNINHQCCQTTVKGIEY